ncbi:MAG: TonB-dependent receptor [Flavobacteriaceae bacterium]|nr:TonB-dependent receptor [Flavobacteriaceae bacterium]
MLLIKNCNKKLLITIILLILTNHIKAQSDSIELKTLNLKEVILNSTKIDSKKKSMPLSVTIIDSINLDILQQNSLKEFINNIPGVFSLNSNNYAQDLRISIRGFGARSAFGIRGIKLIVDGIPETTPDGQGQLDNLNLGIIKRIEVIRGPIASLYGSSSGGVISVQSISDFEKNFINLKTTIGDYGMKNYQAVIGLKKSKFEVLFHANKFNTNGYRERGINRQKNFLTKVSYKTKNNGNFKFLISYTDSPFAGDPGGLNNDERKLNRRGARQKNIDYDSHEVIDHFKTSLKWEYKPISNIKLSASSFFSNRNFFGKLPFENSGIVDLKRNYGGGNFNISLFQENEKYVNTLYFGTELSIQNDHRKRFNNLKGDKGKLILDQIESFDNVAVFLIDHFKYKNIVINLGLRWDQNILATNRELLDIKLNKINPNIALGYQVTEKLNFWTSFSSSFETPTLSELSSNPYSESGLNPNLSSQSAYNYEIGVKRTTRNSYFEIVAFYIPTTNEITPYEIELYPGRKFYRNAGKTKRKGIEINFNHNFSNLLKLENSFTFSDFKYDEFNYGSKSFKGNFLPGIPKNQLNSALNIKLFKDIFLRAEINFVDHLYTSDANQVKESSFWLGKIKIRKEISRSSFVCVPFLGINNIFNTAYSDNIRINAFGGRYFEPAPLRNIYFGLKLGML